MVLDMEERRIQRKLYGIRLELDPTKMLFGEGPAETVSRAAFMTTDSFLHPNSPLRIFDLKPAQIALQADASAREDSATSHRLTAAFQAPSESLVTWASLACWHMSAFSALY